MVGFCVLLSMKKYQKIKENKKICTSLLYTREEEKNGVGAGGGGANLIGAFPLPRRRRPVITVVGELCQSCWRRPIRPRRDSGVQKRIISEISILRVYL